jgi:hypothetical protein
VHEKVVWLLTSQGVVGDELDWRKRWFPPPDPRCLFDHLIGEQHRGTSRALLIALPLQSRSSHVHANRGAEVVADQAEVSR